ncbi:MAG: hypothetical protein ACR2ME_03035 [Acidimicrobiia bacterium]
MKPAAIVSLPFALGHLPGFIVEGGSVRTAIARAQGIADSLSRGTKPIRSRLAALLAAAALTSACGASDQSDIVAVLSNEYEQCVIAHGFDPGGVQVVLTPDSKTLLAVKTGRPVPAGIHMPCWEVIGGNPVLPG